MYLKETEDLKAKQDRLKADQESDEWDVKNTVH